MMEIWNDLLQEQEPRLVEYAFTEYFKAGADFFPVPSQIIKLIDEWKADPENQKTWTTGWVKMLEGNMVIDDVKELSAPVKLSSYLPRIIPVIGKDGEHKGYMDTSTGKPVAEPELNASGKRHGSILGTGRDRGVGK